MLPDAETLTLAYLRARPDLAGVTFGALRPADPADRMPFVLVETSRRRRRAFVTGPTRWSTGPASPRRAGQGPNRTDARHLVHRVMHSLSTIPRVSLWAVGGTVRVVILAGPTPLPSPAAPEHLHRLAATIRIALICGALAIIVPSGRPRACRGHTTSAPGKPSRPWLGYAATNVGQIREEGGPLTGSRYHHLPGCARLNVGHSAEAAGSSVHSAMSGSPTSSSGHCILADRVYFIVDNTKGPGSRAPSLTDVQKVADVVLASLLITAPPMHRMAARWRASVWRHGRRGRAAAAQGADRKHRVRPPGASGRRGPRYSPSGPRRTWHGSPPARSPGCQAHLEHHGREPGPASGRRRRMLYAALLGGPNRV